MLPGDSDFFLALFGALAHVAPLVDSPQSTALSAFSSPSDALLKTLSASVPTVGRCILEEIRADVRANKLQLLQRQRLGLRKARQAKRRQIQRLNAVVAAQCDAALLDAATHDQKFEFFLTDTHAKAVARLQVTIAVAVVLVHIVVTDRRFECRLYSMSALQR